MLGIKGGDWSIKKLEIFVKGAFHHNCIKIGKERGYFYQKMKGKKNTTCEWDDCGKIGKII